jgi:hypothetical protein
VTIVTHIVGTGYQNGPFMRQVCAWCGAKLIDEDLRRIASPDGHGMSFYPEGKLLEVIIHDGGGFRGSTVLDRDPTGAPPDNACFVAPKPSPRLEVVR